MKQKNKEFIGCIIVSMILIIFTFMATLGFGELVDGKSVNVITFYGLLMIGLFYKLGNFLEEPLVFIVNFIKYTYNKKVKGDRNVQQKQP